MLVVDPSLLLQLIEQQRRQQEELERQRRELEELRRQRQMEQQPGGY